MEDFLRDLNDAQRRAVTHGEGPLLVLAGPGSGKTTVIVRRIQYLISQMHIPPEEILVITFTRDAARSMQRRFTEQAATGLPVNFGTFHSVFYHIILETQRSRSNSGQGFKLITDAQKKSLLIPILRDIRRRADGNFYAPDNFSSDAGEILAAISFYKNTGELTGAVKKLPEEWKPCFDELAERYRQAVADSGGLDFDDMVFECGRLMEGSGEIREHWQNRFSHILIDEFQDINPMQYHVVKLLAGERRNVFAVGDDDQAIYGFRGSSPQCLQLFEEEFQAQRTILNLNYRSCGEIVEASTRVIGENKTRYRKDLKAVREMAYNSIETRVAGMADSSSGTGDAGLRLNARRPVTILHFQEREQQSAYLTEQVAEFLKNNPDKSCAVLFRTNLFMQGFAAGLEKAGVPYDMREKSGNIYEHFVSRDVMAYLRFAAGDRRRALFLQFMNKPSRFLRREALADMDPVDLTDLKRWYSERGGPHRFEYLDAIETLRAQLRLLERMPPYLGVSYVCKAIGYERWLREQERGLDASGARGWTEVLEWLREDAKGYETLEEWMEAQEKYMAAVEKHGEKHGLRYGVKSENKDSVDTEESVNRVKLMTVHAAKGLEFDKVWMPDCNEKNFPHGSLPDRDAVEEERRIFYVGMTRAKTSLELLWLTGTKERPRLMSRFLNPIAKDYSSSSSSIISSNSQLSKYSSNASETFSYSSSSSM